jgi:hypothetical protein
MLKCPLPAPCSQRWSELAPDPGSERVRFCAACARRVYWCDSQEEIAHHLNRRQCVAFREPDGADEGPVTWVGGDPEGTYGERH